MESIEAKLLNVFKKVKTYLDRDDLNYNVDKKKIQLGKFANDINYRYLKFEDDNHEEKVENNPIKLQLKSNRYKRLTAYIQGALKVNGEIDRSFLNLQKELQILSGMFCIIDPTLPIGDPQQIKYLLGRLHKEDENFLPSLYFKWFSFIKNYRGSYEFIEMNADLLDIYEGFNKNTREKITINNDYPYLFSSEGKKLYRTKTELNNNFLYISSGEIDFFLILFIVMKFKENNILDSTITFESLLDIFEFDKNYCNKYFSDKEVHFDLSIFLAYMGFYDKTIDDSAHKKFKFDNISERMIAAIEFFVNVFQIVPNNNEFLYSINTFVKDYKLKLNERTNFNKFKELWNEYKEQYKKSYTNQDFNKTQDLVKEFLHLLSNLEFSNQKISDIEILNNNVRFNLLTHFYQRCFIRFVEIKNSDNEILNGADYIETTCKGFLAFPILSNRESDNNDKIPTSVFFYCLIKDSDFKGRNYFTYENETKDSDGKRYSTIKNFYENQIYYIQSLAFNLGRIESQNIYYKNIVTGQRKKLEEKATRAALSQVLARNLSHNIGSHVLSKFKSGNEIDKIDEEFFKDKIDNQYIPFEKLHYLTSSGKDDKKNESSLVDLPSNQLAFFNSYIKCRMDFLADVATSDPVMESPRLFVGDIIKGFDQNRILLNRISGISSDKLKFKLNVLRNGKEYSKENDIAISIPNDVIGDHALYILLENIIRNIAKHSKIALNKDNPIIITLDIKECKFNPDLYELSIYDNIFKTKNEIQKLIKSRNESFKETVLDKSNNLRPYGLGTIEMDLCAAYLRCKPLLQVDDDKYEIEIDSKGLAIEPGCIQDNKLKSEKCLDPYLIFAYPHDSSDDTLNSSLGYKLYLSKPKEVLIIDDTKEFKIKDCDLNKFGIEVISSDELIIDTSKIYKHQFLYIHNSDTIDDNFINHKNNYARLPKRIVLNQLTEEFQTVDAFKLAVWKKYLSYKSILKPDSKIKLCVRDNCQSLDSELKLEKTTCSSTPDIYIDNHNELYDEYKNKDKLFYDMKCSHSRIDKLVSNNTFDCDFNSEKIKIDRAIYLENVYSNIIILDERIQDNIYISVDDQKEYAATVPFGDYFTKQNVLIPNKTILNLNESSFENQVDNLKCFISKIKNQNTFLIIHLGVIEKFMICKEVETVLEEFKDKEDKLSNFIDKFLCNEFLLRKNIQITSGRGVPADLPIDISFIPISAIQNAVETLFDKLVLTNLVHNARKAQPI